MKYILFLLVLFSVLSSALTGCAIEPEVPVVVLPGGHYYGHHIHDDDDDDDD